jgi:hypothetical protein
VQVLLPALELLVLFVLLLSDFFAHLYLVVDLLKTRLLLNTARSQPSPEIYLFFMSTVLEFDVFDVNFYAVCVCSFLGGYCCCFVLNHICNCLELGNFEDVS